MSKPKKPAEASAAVVAPEKAPKWSVAELIEVAHLGPAIIGAEMHAAAQAYARQNGGTALGPATRGE